MSAYETALLVTALLAHAWGWIFCALLALRRGRRARANHAAQLENVRAANRRLQHAYERELKAPPHLRYLR